MAVGCTAPELLHLYPELSPAPASLLPAPRGQVVLQLLSSRERLCKSPFGWVLPVFMFLLVLTGSDTSVLP